MRLLWQIFTECRKRSSIACVWSWVSQEFFFHEKCRYCQSFLEHGIKQNVSSLVARITKHDTKEDNLVESREDKGQVTEDTETKESSDVILTQLEKDKSALYMIDEAYDIAIDKFMKV